MGKPQKKIGTSGAKKKKSDGAIKKAIAKVQNSRFISRTRAMRKLQLTLPQFRRLCVLKGIHPVQPTSKVMSKHRTFYHQMDIRFIGRDPLINKMREYSTYKKALSKAKGKHAYGAFHRLMKEKPDFNIDHVVRERYPSFMDAVNDLEDPLCMIFICARMKANVCLKPQLISECLRLSSEFLTYVAQSNSLRKVFVTIKGIYYQAEIMGVTINWLVPLEYALEYDRRVDNRLINNFVEFYIRMMSFVNYKLYSTLGLVYPPRRQKAEQALGNELAFTLLKVEKNQTSKLAEAEQEEKSARVREALEIAQQAPVQELTASDKKRISLLESQLNKMATSEESEPSEQKGEENTEEPAEVPRELETAGTDGAIDMVSEEEKRHRPSLFKDLIFFINREVPLVHLSFMIKSFQGQVSFTGGKFEENDSRITHQIVDREYPLNKRVKSREYVQPQWVFDSINTGILLPVHEYSPEATLPPHLSPFVTPEAEGYVPDQRKHLDYLIARETGGQSVNELGNANEENEENEDNGDEESEEEDIETRYYKELRQESGGMTYSDVFREQEEKRQAVQAAKDAEEAEQARLYEAAGLPYAPPTKKGKKTSRKEAEEEEFKARAKIVMGRSKLGKFKSIERRRARKEEEVQKLHEKKQSIQDRALDAARKKLQGEDSTTSADNADKPSKKKRKHRQKKQKK